MFNSVVRGNRDVYVIQAEGGGLSQLTNHPSADEKPRLVGRWKVDLLSVRPQRPEAGLEGVCGWR